MFIIIKTVWTLKTNSVQHTYFKLSCTITHYHSGRTSHRSSDQCRRIPTHILCQHSTHTLCTYPFVLLYLPYVLNQPQQEVLWSIIKWHISRFSIFPLCNEGSNPPIHQKPTTAISYSSYFRAKTATRARNTTTPAIFPPNQPLFCTLCTSFRNKMCCCHQPLVLVKIGESTYRYKLFGPYGRPSCACVYIGKSMETCERK